MALRKSVCFFLLFLVTLISCTHARTFEVGGKDGWTTSPSENYNSWAGRLRFLINDSLHFKYGGGDSVLVVSKGDYDGCNVNNPITKLEGGDSTFKLDRSGPFYFISGNKSSCDQGQKLTVVVITPKNRSPPGGAATPPSPAATPPSPAATPPSSTATPPSSTATPPSSTTAPPPSSTTAPPPSSIATPPSPSTVSPVSPSPLSASPESSMSPSGSPTSTPSGDAPAMTPGASSPGAAGGPGGATDGPGGAASGPGGAAAGGPGGAAGSPGTNPSDTNSPSGATQALSGTIMASFVTMVFGLWLLN